MTHGRHMDRDVPGMPGRTAGCARQKKVANATRRVFWMVVPYVWLVGIGPAAAARASDHTQQPEAAAAATRIALRSPRFLLHTDLPQAEAQQTLTRMQAVLKAAERYWQRPSRGQIVCYVVDDLTNWPDSALPHPLARVWVGGVGGATIADTVGAGRETRIRATVYAVPRPGVVEHEIVHAYCYQTFGDAGPEWYKEGMAQWLAHGAATATDLGCPPELVLGLTNTTSATVREIVQAGRFTVGISDSFGAMLANRRDQQAHVPLSDWTALDGETVRLAQQHYLRSWALCHLLLGNPNYSARFRALGTSFLTKGRDSFDNAFGADGQKLTFEYAFFLQHVDVGYRVDLCHWDWSKRFRTLDAPEMRGTARARIEAARGYQASGLTVVTGQRYAYATTGAWGTSAGEAMTCAEGDAEGRGRMMAAVLADFRLSEPFELGREGLFESSHCGDLYLRCRSDWTQLHHNHGAIHIQFTRPKRGGG